MLIFIKKAKLLTKMRTQNTNAIFFTLGFCSIHLFSSSNDQVLRPISLVLSCKCRELLTLLYIIGKLSNCMLYNYMFSSLEMDPGNSFSQGKNPQNKTQQTHKTKNHSCTQECFFSLFGFCVQMRVIYLLFLLSVLYTNIGG